MDNKDQEIEHLRESLKICSDRLKEYRELLFFSIGILKSKHVIIMKKDDEFRTTVEEFIEKCSENGLVDSQQVD